MNYLATVANIPNIYGKFAGQTGQLVGRYGEHFLTVKFTNNVTEEFPANDVHVEERTLVDPVTVNLESPDKILWAQIMSRFYGDAFYLRRGQVTGMYGHHFVIIPSLREMFPVYDVTLTEVDRGVFHISKVRFDSWETDVSRIVHYFTGDWNYNLLMFDLIEYNLNVTLSFADKQTILEYLPDEESIWYYTETSFNSAEYAKATFEAEIDARISVDEVFKLLVKLSSKNETLKKSLQESMYTIYQNVKRRRIPKYQKIILSIELWKRIRQDYGIEFEEALIKAMGDPKEMELTVDEANEQLPAEEDLVPEARVRAMKTRPSTIARIDLARSLGKDLNYCFDTLIDMYSSLIREWSESDNPDIKVSPEQSYRDSESFSYKYLLTLCENMITGLGALGVLEKTYELDELRECFAENTP